MTFVGGMSLSEQGVFDAIQNLGALVARFLFKVCYLLLRKSDAALHNTNAFM